MNNLFTIMIFSAHVLLSAAGMVILKSALTDKKISFESALQIFFGIKFMFGMSFYVLGFLLWIYILSKYKLNVALPIAQSLFFVVSIIGSFFILQESLSMQHMIGISLCLVGILLIAVN